MALRACALEWCFNRNGSDHCFYLSAEMNFSPAEPDILTHFRKDR
jgi:hypothetical protein